MKKLLIILLWIVLFPFMLTYWGWKTKKKPVMVIGAILSILIIVGSLADQAPIDNTSVGETKPTIESEVAYESDVNNKDEATPEGEVSQSNGEASVETKNPEVASEDERGEEQTTPEDSSDSTSENSYENSSENATESEDTNLSEEDKQETTSSSDDPKVDISQDSIFEGYKLIKVDGGNLSGHRESNVAVDIGFGDREYWAFTNEYGQLVKVTADTIILQDDSNEPVNSKGRYYWYEAKVPGTESSTLDEGHVIANSLGGVSNAFNITPQNSTSNRHGDQAYMEKGSEMLVVDLINHNRSNYQTRLLTIGSEYD